ncbi:MAG: hypothetical protein ACFFA0_14065 [Promethearchaeota archaeon]
MREIKENNTNLDLNAEDLSENKDFPLIYLFWLKIVFGIIAGLSHYYIQTTLYYIGGFNINFIYRGYLIVVIFLVLLFSLQFLIILLLYVSKKKAPKLVPQNEIIWRFSFRFSIIFFSFFLITVSIAFYFGI